jgi:hypothetical protein
MSAIPFIRARDVAEEIALKFAPDCMVRPGEAIDAIVAAIDAAVAAETERCARIADAYAEENSRMAGDTILLSPAFHGVWTKESMEKEGELQIDGCIHSSMFHAAQNIAAAIRAAQP